MQSPRDLGRCSLEGTGGLWLVPEVWGDVEVAFACRVKPSSLCGPFRTLDTMYEAGKVWVRRLEKEGPRVSWLPWIHRNLVENTFPIYLVSALLL